MNMNPTPPLWIIVRSTIRPKIVKSAAGVMIDSPVTVSADVAVKIASLIVSDRSIAMPGSVRMMEKIAMRSRRPKTIRTATDRP